MDNKEHEILETAEKMVREGGYNNFSFRNIATAVGVKSSSVHYYFPTKADLGAAVATYYTDKFFKHIGDPVELTKDKEDPIKVYIKAFRDALEKDRRMCLCGLLGAEIDGLPQKVTIQIKIFFERNIEWITIAYTLKDNNKDAKNQALQTLAVLEGAMIMANIWEDLEVFDAATLHL